MIPIWATKDPLLPPWAQVSVYIFMIVIVALIIYHAKTKTF